MFLALLYDVAKSKDLFGTGPSFPEASLLFSQDVIHLVFKDWSNFGNFKLSWDVSIFKRQIY